MTSNPIRRYAIVVAGGSGTRMNSPVPKQFILLNGRPVLMHTLSRFLETGFPIDIILVLNPGQIGFWEQLCREHGFNARLRITEGGETRFHSVKNGLALIEGDGIVAVHDAARPLVSAKTIVTAFKAAEMYGNAVPAVPLSDSIRQIDSTLSIAVDRSRFCKIQTPQCFDVRMVKHAYNQEYRYTFTDDATVVESIGEKIHLIDGNTDNIKITTPEDIVIAEALMSYRQAHPVPANGK
jgi:2-C-methyl-D-erythritol 4-phosphate cytidylyltransferase